MVWLADLAGAILFGFPGSIGPLAGGEWWLGAPRAGSGTDSGISLDSGISGLS